MNLQDSFTQISTSEKKEDMEKTDGEITDDIAGEASGGSLREGITPQQYIPKYISDGINPVYKSIVGERPLPPDRQ